MTRLRCVPLLVCAVLASGVACGRDSGDAADSASVAGSNDDAVMRRGLELLYARNDPEGAESWFRELLRRNPTHYGATFQLAVALDRAGKPTEARPLWEEAQRLAGTYGDTAGGNAARTRLAGPDTLGQSALMHIGLRELYARNNAAAAESQFRQVITRNPTHYGAHYQLAVALDRLGRRSEARPLWEKVLGMAVFYKDSTTIGAARTRLRQSP